MPVTLVDPDYELPRLQGLTRSNIGVTDVRKNETYRFPAGLPGCQPGILQAADVRYQVGVPGAEPENAAAVPDIKRLVSGLSQEIMSPLGAVLKNIQLAKIKLTQEGESKNKEFKSAIDVIEDNAVLCKNILYSLSMPPGGARGSLQRISLNDIVAKVDNIVQ